LKHRAARPDAGRLVAVDESVPSQQGLKQWLVPGELITDNKSMSPFHHNKD